MKKIYFIRANKTPFGGAENYLTRLSASLNKQNIEHGVINSPFPKFLGSWVRALLFNTYASLIKRDKFYFSLERITCPDIYRAGDGVHKKFLDIEKKSRINPLHFVYLFLEKRCFRNAKHIIANSKMIKDQIVQVYDIDSNKISVVYRTHGRSIFSVFDCVLMIIPFVFVHIVFKHRFPISGNDSPFDSSAKYIVSRKRRKRF